MGDWKCVKYNVLAPEKATLELYDLESDPGEQNNIATQFPHIVKHFEQLFIQTRNDSDVFVFEQ
jgi:arylsulfatase A-like enzyme